MLARKLFLVFWRIFLIVIIESEAKASVSPSINKWGVYWQGGPIFTRPSVLRFLMQKKPLFATFMAMLRQSCTAYKDILVHIHVHMHIRIHIHTYTYTYTYTYIFIPRYLPHPLCLNTHEHSFIFNASTRIQAFEGPQRPLVRRRLRSFAHAAGAPHVRS